MSLDVMDPIDKGNIAIGCHHRKIIYVTGPAKINHLSAKKSVTFFVFALS